MRVLKFHVLNFSSLKRLMVVSTAFVLLIYLVVWSSSYLFAARRASIEGRIDTTVFKAYHHYKGFIYALQFWLPVLGMFLFYTASTGRHRRGYFRFMVGNGVSRSKLVHLDTLFALLFAFVFTLIIGVLFIITSKRFMLWLTLDLFIKTFTTLFMWSILGSLLGMLFKKNFILVIIMIYYYIERQMLYNLLKLYFPFKYSTASIWADLLPFSLLNFPFALSEKYGLQIAGFVLFATISFILYKCVISTDL